MGISARRYTETGPLKCDGLLSNFAFNFNVRRYTKDGNEWEMGLTHGNTEFISYGSTAWGSTPGPRDANRGHQFFDYSLSGVRDLLMWWGVAD
jgi:hypothetical protein